jgi:hypothetical protein
MSRELDDAVRPLDPPRENWIDKAHQMTVTTVNAVTGGAGGTILSMIVGPPVSKRRQQFEEDVEARIEELERQGRIDREKLSEHDQFVSTYIEATLAAVTTHEDEKREALRNAVVNAALPNAPEDVRQQLFIRWVSDLSPWHLRILRYLQSPTLKDKSARVQIMTSSVLSEMLAAVPGLKNHETFVSLWASDLQSRHLLSSFSLSGMVSASGLTAKRTTELGDEFLRFISEPQ